MGGGAGQGKKDSRDSRLRLRSNSSPTARMEKAPRGLFFPHTRPPGQLASAPQDRGGPGKGPVLHQGASRERQQSLQQPDPVPLGMACLQPPPTTPHLHPRAWLLRRVSGWHASGTGASGGGSQAALAILTRKSKLKRRRKYLVTLMQADPILSALELPVRREGR